MPDMRLAYHSGAPPKKVSFGQRCSFRKQATKPGTAVFKAVDCVDSTKASKRACASVLSHGPTESEDGSTSADGNHATGEEGCTCGTCHSANGKRTVDAELPLETCSGRRASMTPASRELSTGSAEVLTPLEVQTCPIGTDSDSMMHVESFSFSEKVQVNSDLRSEGDVLRSNGLRSSGLRSSGGLDALRQSLTRNLATLKMQREERRTSCSSAGDDSSSSSRARRHSGGPHRRNSLFPFPLTGDAFARRNSKSRAAKRHRNSVHENNDSNAQQAFLAMVAQATQLQQRAKSKQQRKQKVARSSEADTHPRVLLSVAANLVRLLIFLVLAASLPMQLSFSRSDPNPRLPTPWAWLHVVLDYALLVDAVACLLAQRHGVGGRLLDVLSSMPSHMLPARVWAVWTLALLRVIRFRRSPHWLLDLQDALLLKPGGWLLAKLVASLLVYLHCVTCACWEFLQAEAANGNTEAVLVEDAADGPYLLVQYTWTVYMVFIMWNGPGDLPFVPASTRGKWFVVMVAISAMLVNAIFVGKIAAAIGSWGAAQRREREDVDKLTEMMSEREVPYDLRRRILRHVKFVAEQSRGEVDEARLLRELPRPLRLQLTLVLHNSLFTCIPLFRRIDARVVCTLVQHMQRSVAMPGDVILSKGKHSRGLWLITRGTVEQSSATTASLDRDGRGAKSPQGGVADPPGPERTALTQGDFFGETCLLRQVSSYTYSALCYTALMLLLHSDLDSVAESFPQLAHELQQARCEAETGPGAAGRPVMNKVSRTSSKVASASRRMLGASTTLSARHEDSPRSRRWRRHARVAVLSSQLASQRSSLGASAVDVSRRSGGGASDFGGGEVAQHGGA